LPFFVKDFLGRSTLGALISFGSSFALQSFLLEGKKGFPFQSGSQ
jgi:hypothetical protein